MDILLVVAVALKDHDYYADEAYDHVKDFGPMSAFAEDYKRKECYNKGCEVANHHHEAHAYILHGEGAQNVTRDGRQLVDDDECFGF